MSSSRHRSHSHTRSRLGVSIPSSSLTGVGDVGASVLSPASYERERALRDLLEREVRERHAIEAAIEAEEDRHYIDGTARDPRLKLRYERESAYRYDAHPQRHRRRSSRHRSRSPPLPRQLDRFGVAAGDADAIYPYEAKYDGVGYTYEHSPSELELPYPDRIESLRHARRRSASPRTRIETYAEERQRELEELKIRRELEAVERERERERDHERRRQSGIGARYVRERDLDRDRDRDRELSKLASSLGALSVREREAMLERERRRDWELSRTSSHRDLGPRDDERRRWKSRASARYDEDADFHSLPPYERARLGSPSRTALRSPLPAGSYATAPYSSTFGKVNGEYLVDPLRSKEREIERELRERELRARDYDRDRELDYGSSEYDSDSDRVYYHPRLHGHAHSQQRFARGYGEPIGSVVGGGATRHAGWLDEFYRPVDVRATKSQWLATLQPPSYTLRNNTASPEARLKLEWIYGYKSFDVRNNLLYNNVGDIIYPVASVVVVYKHNHRIQRHFNVHNNEVRAMAQHPVNLNIIATGQVASNSDMTSPSSSSSTSAGAGCPHIAIWDSTDFTKVWILRLTPADRSIRALAFSGDGKYLASISNDRDHTIKLWDWETRTMLGSARGDSYALFALRWNHKDPTEFVTVGKHHSVVWKFDGVKLTARKLLLPGGKNMTFYSIAFSEKGYACLGGEDGSIYVFVDGRLVREFKKVHHGKIFCLEWFPGGLISGGGDGCVHVLDKKLDILRTFTFHHRITSLYVRGNHLLIGTQGAQIFELVDFIDTNIEGDTRAGSRPAMNGIGTEFQSPDGRIGIEPIVSGHYDGELHAIATTPGGREIVSVGEDNQICVWEMTTHRLLRRALITEEPSHHPPPPRKHRSNAPTTSTHAPHQCARSVAVSPNGKFISVGLNNGEVAVYTAHDLRRIFTHDLTQYSKRQRHSSSAASRDAAVSTNPHWIECIKYSPNGHVVAIGTHGSVIVLLDTRDDYRVKGVLQSHDSFITNLDFSDDGMFLASTDGQYNLKFHQLFEDDLAQSLLVTDQRLIRDVKWLNQNCVLGYTVQGILETGESDGSLIQCLEVSPSRGFVVSGDDVGQVRLFRHPVLERGHQSHQYQAHANQVVRVRWSVDEKYVVSAGGHDNAICQWVVV